MHKNLRSFIEHLRREKDIVEVTAEVDPYLELAEIHRRVVEEAGPALLFTRVKGSAFPVVTNLFGTVKRMEMAMGPKPQAIINRASRPCTACCRPVLAVYGVNEIGCWIWPVSD